MDINKALVWVPLGIAVAAGIGGYYDLRATAQVNKDKIKSIQSESKDSTKERRINREARIRYEVRQEQIKGQLNQQSEQLKEIKQLLQRSR